MAQHLNSKTATLEEKQALASAMLNTTSSNGSSLAEASSKAKDFADQRREGFQPGDRVVIEPGYATVQTVTINGAEVSYLGFEATVTRGSKTHHIPVSINALQSKTFAVRPEGEDAPSMLQRKDLLYRFGKRFEVSFEGVEVGGKPATSKKDAEPGTTVQLRKLEDRVDVVLSKTAGVADIAGTYVSGDKAYMVQRSAESFGYAENH